MFSLPASVRDIYWFLCLPGKNLDFSGPKKCCKVLLYDAKTEFKKNEKLTWGKKMSQKQAASVRDIYACPTQIKVKTTEFRNLGEQKIHCLHI